MNIFVIGFIASICSDFIFLSIEFCICFLRVSRLMALIILFYDIIANLLIGKLY